MRWQCTYNVAVSRVRLTIVALKKQQWIVCVCWWATLNYKLYKNTVCYTTVFEWQICVASNNNRYVYLYVKCPMLHWNKRMYLCSWLYLDV